MTTTEISLDLVALAAQYWEDNPPPPPPANAVEITRAYLNLERS